MLVMRPHMPPPYHSPPPYHVYLCRSASHSRLVDKAIVYVALRVTRLL